MPKVTLISATPQARELLIFTKQTRLEMSPDTMARVIAMSDAEKDAELAYMAGTIRSSWEFVDLTFLIQGTTRAIAQQITRTRQASYAMQSLRVVDARDIPVTNPFAGGDDIAKEVHFDLTAEEAKATYGRLVTLGAAKEDARGILPMNTQTSLVAKYNLRAFVDLVAARRSLRAQGEYGDIVRQMHKLALEVWPWSAPFFESPHAAAIEMLEKVARELGVETGKGPAWDIAKAIDLLRKDA
jgi:thymidylate synthase (FAD)